MINMIKIFVTAILSMLIINSAEASSLQDKCAEIYMDNKPEVFITYNYGQLKYDNSKNSEELGEMYEEISGGNSFDNIQGLTDLNPKLTTEVGVDVAMIDEENFCFYPRKINIKLFYEPTIYILDSLQPGSCRFNVTVRHEQTHLDLGHHALYLFAKSLREAVPDILSSVNPIVRSASVADGDEIVKNMTNAYHEQAKLYFEMFKENLLEYNSKLDSPENYKQETKLCKKY